MLRWTLAALLLAQVRAQTPKLEYEVVSVKPTDPGVNFVRIQMPPGGRYVAQGVTVRELILAAYRLQRFQLSGGPGWIETERFDVDARPESGVNPTQDQTREMLQAMLADRFQLRVRKENRQLPSYNLVIAKGGLKMKASADQSQPERLAAPPPPGAGGALPRGMMRMAPGFLTASAAQMPMLVNQLSASSGRLVLDKTSLTGFFDMELRWTPDQMPANPPGPPPGGPSPFPQVDPNGPSLFAALEEQLGLKLDSSTAPAEVLIIERIEKPSAN